MGTDLRLVVPAAAAWLAAAWVVAVQPSTAWVAVAVVTVAAGVAAVTRFAASLLVLAVVVAVLAAAAGQLQARASGALSTWADERATATVVAVAASDAQRIRAVSAWGAGQPRFAVHLHVTSVQARGRWSAADAPVLVFGQGAWQAVTAGQPLRARVRLAPSASGDDAVALATALAAPEPTGRAAWQWRAAAAVRVSLAVAARDLPGDGDGLFPALVDGDTAAVPDGLVNDLRIAGLTHLTAVSGANVAITAGAVLWLVARLGAGRRLRVVLALASVAAFVVLARPQPSVLRAAVMGGLGLVGLLLARPGAGVPLLAGAVIGLLVVDPWLSRSAGFALSTFATGALLTLGPAWASRLARVLPEPAAVALAAPAAAQAVCGPVVVLLQPAVAPWSVVANLLAEPVVAPTTILGVVAAALAPVWQTGAHLVAWVGGLGTGWVALVAHTVAGWPGASTPWPGGWPGAVALALLTALLVLASLRVRPAPGRAEARVPA